MRRSSLASLAVALGMFAATPAEAAPQAARSDCRLIMDVGSARWAIPDFDPYDTDAPFKPFQVNLTNIGEGECSGSLELELAGEPFGMVGQGGARLVYAVVDEDSGQDLTPRAGRSARALSGRRLRLGPGETITRFLSLVVDVDRLQGDGDFIQRVRLQAVSDNRDVMVSRDMSLELGVRPSASITLAGAIDRRANATVSLGDLAPGVQDAPLQVQIRSTRGYRIGLTSENRGSLRAGKTGWSVPYDLVIDGQRHGLSEPSSFRSRGSGAQTDRYDIGFYIGDVSGRRAGRYSDVITITVTPL